jgi:hypothetical protein
LLSLSLHRLAAANHLDAEDLRLYLTGETRALHASIDVSTLALLADLPEQHLRRALLELSCPGQLAELGAIPGRARPYAAEKSVLCRQCAAARDPGQRIVVWQTHENLLCLRHRIWTRTLGGAAHTQLDLREHPEIVEANRIHRRLIRRYGRAPVHAAFRHAQRICTQWHEDWRSHNDEARRGLIALGRDPDRTWLGDPALAAATYRQVIALTRLLASPGLSGLILGDHAATRPEMIGADLDLAGLDVEIDELILGGEIAAEAERDLLREALFLAGKPNTRRFAEQVRETVAPDYAWLPVRAYNTCEPLAEWVADQLRAATHPLGLSRFPPPRPEVFTLEHLQDPTLSPVYVRGRLKTPTAAQLREVSDRPETSARAGSQSGC